MQEKPISNNQVPPVDESEDCAERSVSRRKTLYRDLLDNEGLDQLIDHHDSDYGENEEHNKEPNEGATKIFNRREQSSEMTFRCVDCTSRVCFFSLVFFSCLFERWSKRVVWRFESFLWNLHPQERTKR